MEWPHCPQVRLHRRDQEPEELHHVQIGHDGGAADGESASFQTARWPEKDRSFYSSPIVIVG